MRNPDKPGYYAHCSACGLNYFIDGRKWLAKIKFWAYRRRGGAFVDCGEDKDCVWLIRLD